ncbi:MAG TPA: hypothetical protein VLA56_05920 [Pseudomonadales bacterium]|nr:hypothetical protein [Pseudomonadales bacterium]
MGQEIDRSEFTAQDVDAFAERLAAETARLARWFSSQRFSRRAFMAGFELEAWLIDDAAQPCAMNENYLRTLGNDLVVPELSQFNVELNGSPTSLQGKAFSRLAEELEHTWAECRACAESLGAHILMTGILPTVPAEALHLGNMSKLSRYAALNERLLAMRHGVPFELRINGRERIRRTHPDVMLEAAATSFQIHLQVRQANAVRLYNAAQVVSAPMVAVSANSPYLFGHDLWDETRIPVFEQAVAAGDGPFQRVTFGQGYVRDSLFELFAENLEHYPVLIPSLRDDSAGSLPHLRFHNGTIWRWNRPLLGFDHDGVPHLRIEHRVVPAGPTVADGIANAAFFYGMVAALAVQDTPIESRLPFAAAKDNFYAAARHGLEAGLRWPGADGSVEVRTLILEELLPLAQRGLAWLGIPDDEIEHYLAIIEGRVQSRVNGACWQRRWVERHGRDFAGLTRAMLERQATGVPVHRWAI